jgi:hypothetical protein
MLEIFAKVEAGFLLLAVLYALSVLYRFRRLNNVGSGMRGLCHLDGVVAMGLVAICSAVLFVIADTYSVDDRASVILWTFAR